MNELFICGLELKVSIKEKRKNEISELGKGSHGKLSLKGQTEPIVMMTMMSMRPRFTTMLCTQVVLLPLPSIFMMASFLLFSK